MEKVEKVRMEVEGLRGIGLEQVEQVVLKERLVREQPMLCKRSVARRKDIRTVET